jgi:drug/metabolite transporter (DMT)-like permease
VLRGIFFMLLAAVAFALMSVGLKQAGLGLGTFQVVFFRSVIAWIILLAWERTQGPVVFGQDWKGLFSRAVFGFGALVLYTWAIKHIDLGLASALNQSSPIFVAVFSGLFLKERVPRAILPLAAFAFVGVCLIVTPDFRSVNSSALVGLASAALAALAYVQVRRLRHSESPSVIVRWFSFWSAAFALPLMLVEGYQQPTVLEWGALALSGLMGLLGQMFMTHAYRCSKAAMVSPFLYFQVLANLALGLVLFNEWPHGNALAGCFVLLLATFAIGRISSQEARPGVNT